MTISKMKPKVRQTPSSASDDVYPGAPEHAGPAIPDTTAKAGTENERKKLTWRQATAFLDNWITTAFERMEDRGYADEFKVPGKTVRLAAVSIIGEKFVKIRFKPAQECPLSVR
ncbi:MAG: hypothetical protein LBQ79_00225 [Deltaproteobacteria bacterium]|jgi:hypothetical protein|nr:hypothetical protein [Deltaproteobacteria bacterium]